MEYIDGETLSEIVKNKVSIQHWKRECSDLVLTLQNLHNHGNLHNDLHSRSIILRNYKYVTIIDFGKAALIDDPVEYNIRK